LKVCTRCHQPKSLLEFSKGSRKDGLQSRCKLCFSEIMKIYREENIKAVKERGALDYAKNRDAYISRSKKRYAENTEKIKKATASYQKANPEKRAAWNSSYSRANKDKVCALTAARNARKLLATPLWVNHCAIRDVYSEAERLTTRTGIAHQVDHIVPLRSPLVCGLHWEGNLQIISAVENRKKSNRYWPDMP